MLEGPGHEQRAARLLRAFQVASRAGQARWPMRPPILQARNVGLVGLGRPPGAGTRRGVQPGLPASVAAVIDADRPTGGSSSLRSVPRGD